MFIVLFVWDSFSFLFGLFHINLNQLDMLFRC